jgi:hypothetical protein
MSSPHTIFAVADGTSAAVAVGLDVLEGIDIPAIDSPGAIDVPPIAWPDAAAFVGESAFVAAQPVSRSPAAISPIGHIRLVISSLR